MGSQGADYRYSRTLAIPLTPDPDPNTAQPDTKDVFALQERPPSGQLWTSAHALYGVFRDAVDAVLAGGSVTFQTWERDLATGRWVLAAGATVPAGQKALGNGIQNVDLFVQVLAVVAPGGATSLLLRATEQGTNEGLGYGAEMVLGTVVADQGAPNTLANGWPVKITDGVNVLGTVAHPLQVSETDTAAGTSTVTDIPASPVTVPLLAPNAARIAATIFNDSNKALTLKLGTGATPISRTTQLPPKSEYSLPARYTGIITGFWDAGAVGSAGVTELTP